MNQKPATATFDLPAGQAIEQVQRDIQRRLIGRLREFRLLLRDGGLILKGSAHTYYAKQLAQEAVKAAIELPIRANEIRVL